jgi:hypothetical protein
MTAENRKFLSEALWSLLTGVALFLAVALLAAQKMGFTDIDSAHTVESFYGQF